MVENMRHILHSEWMKGLPTSDTWKQLIPYSTLAYFLTMLNDSFCKSFAKYEDDFIGIDKNAMFAGTVIHSLDHTMFLKVSNFTLVAFL